MCSKGAYRLGKNVDQKLCDVKGAIRSAKKNQSVLESTAGKSIVKEVGKGTDMKTSSR